MKRKRGKERRNRALAPLDATLTPRQRMEAAVELSELVMRIATYLICYMLVEHREQLLEERMKVAHAMLQRVMTMHLCNHQMTTNGLVYEYKGQPFMLHEEYKTMTLTRSVYEHLTMFYLLFEQPETDEERTAVWRNWKGGRRKELPSYSQAWKYLFDDEEMATFYRELSMHCHPVYQGLMQYHEQSVTDEGNDSLALYFSCRFVACLCRLFIKQLTDGSEVIKGEFTDAELAIFKELSQMRGDKINK